MESLDIGVDALREWLDNGQKVTVLDIRPMHQRSEWSIPGSIHVDASQSLAANAPSPLDTIDLPDGTPVVAVCAMGFTSKRAVGALRSRGIPALSLAGGMKAWSLAWNLAEVELQGLRARLIQVRRTGKGCISYIVASEGEATVVDPSVDAEIYLKIASENGFAITRVIDTHIHADHLSRSRLLVASTGAQLCLPEQKRVSFPHQPLRDGDVLNVGSAHIEVLHTPGHTMESCCYLVDGRALLTGDTLFPAAVGRPDLAASASDEARNRARALYASLARLNRLPDDTWIYACHTSEPIAFDRQPHGAPLSQVRHNVKALGQDQDAFVETVLARIPPNPPNHLTIVRLNEAGQFPEGDPTELEAGANRCAIS